MGRLFSVAGFRFRATLRSRGRGYLGVVVLIALVGGVAMASVAAGRRTQSAYPLFLGRTNPSALEVSVALRDATPATSAALTRRIARLPHVVHAATLLGPNFELLGLPRGARAGEVPAVGSLDGLLARQDRMTIVAGRAADPGRADEVVVTRTAAALLRVHVGDEFDLGLLPGVSTYFALTPSPSPASPHYLLRQRVRVVGVAVLNNQVIQDDVDRTFGYLVVTPALLRRAIARAPGAAVAVLYGLQLDHGDASAAAVEGEIIGAVPPGGTYQFHETARIAAAAELSVKPESVALGGFGAIAALVCLVLGAQALARQARRGADERRVLRALGARPGQIMGEGLIGSLGAVLLGAAGAVAVALLLSPLGPIGPMRAVLGSVGFDADPAVLAVGAGTLVAVLGAVCALQAIRQAPHRPVARAARGRGRSMRVAQGAGLPPAGVLGVHFALDSSRGGDDVPVRSVVAGSVVAVALVVATITFASGLSTLISHPRLYGWNWTYVLTSSEAVPPSTLSALGADPDVAGWSGFIPVNAQIDGVSVPMLLMSNRAAVAPPLLSGHGVDATDQIVLGAETLAQLHTAVGRVVTASYGSPSSAPVYVAPTRLRVVGSATFPAVGYSSLLADHPSMGVGAIISEGVLSPAFVRAITNPDPTLSGPPDVFVRLKPSVGVAADRADIERIVRAADRTLNADPRARGAYVVALGVQRPAQIVNYRSMGSTPELLAVGLAAGAAVALGLTLAASVRRRRRDFAVLKSLGVTRRQLAAAVAWQATVDAALGAVVGVPLGVVGGRALWTVFARSINAVPDATVPVVAVVVVAACALAFANVVAALPGRLAARTSVAAALRAE